jgi:hypothetical protein
MAEPKVGPMLEVRSSVDDGGVTGRVNDGNEPEPVRLGARAVPDDLPKNDYFASSQSVIARMIAGPF